MEITCHNCKKTWEVPPGHILGAKLKFGLGFKEHGFICPNCGEKNVVTEQEFEAAMKHPGTQPGHVPVTGESPTTGGRPTTGTAPHGGSTGPGTGVVGRPVTGPVSGPGPTGRQRNGVVVARSLHVRKDHNTHSETMAGLRKGDHVTILGTWTDGQSTWAQLGPERWAAIEYNGEGLIELTD